ncbi:MAG: sugar ABC transporter permease [Clostridiales bacterium]|jgi:multiple sugar transport system permease protein|nr:sugar ABC transporter permease [Clostridiales bacterium]
MMAALRRFLERRSSAVLIFPYALLFSMFVIIPISVAIGLGFTYYNTVQPPRFVGFSNYIALFTNDPVFMQRVLPLTVLFSLVVGIGGYFLSFLMAWSIAQMPKLPRTVMAIVIYSPSLTGAIMQQNIWSVFFNGDKSGWLNYVLLELSIIEKPVMWLQETKTLFGAMLAVSLWSSMGVGFLAILAGILNGNAELYEAAYIDGVRNRWQEIVYVTIPQARPQMLFGAIMSIVGTIQSANIGVALFGRNPTPDSAGQLIISHIEDYGFQRFEMGYAAAISVVLLVAMRLVSVGAERLFGDRE